MNPGSNYILDDDENCLDLARAFTVLLVVSDAELKTNVNYTVHACGIDLDHVIHRAADSVARRLGNPVVLGENCWAVAAFDGWIQDLLC